MVKEFQRSLFGTIPDRDGQTDGAQRADSLRRHNPTAATLAIL